MVAVWVAMGVAVAREARMASVVRKRLLHEGIETANFPPAEL